MSRSKTYYVWIEMRQRCENRNNPAYKNYGQRGIKVCKRWQKFENFLQDLGKKPKGLSLDRLDNSKGYSKLNCRWTDRVTQNNNRRSNILLEDEGDKYTMAQYSRKFGINYSTLRSRIYRNQPIEDLI